VNGFNVVYQQFIVGFKVSAHPSTLPQKIPHPVTLNWHWANKICSIKQQVPFFSVFDLTQLGIRTPDLPHRLYPLNFKTLHTSNTLKRLNELIVYFINYLSFEFWWNR